MRGRFAALDGLRGLFALAVVAMHFFGPAVVPGGYLAVDFFFVLSGFVVSHAYAAQIAEGRMSFLRFAQVRLARLYPLYFVTIWLGMAAIFAVGGGALPDWAPNGYSIFTNLLLVQDIGFDDKWGWNGVSWSISVEVWVNALLFGLLVCLPRRIFLLVAALLAFIAYLMLFRASPHLNVVKETVLGMPCGLLRGVGGIFAGVLVHALAGAMERRSSLAVSAVGVVGLVCLLWLTSFRTGREDFLAPVFASMVVASFALEPRAILARVAAAPPLAFLGGISYSVYLLHQPLIRFVSASGIPQAVTSSVPFGIAFVLAVIGLSWATCRLIEEPARRMLGASTAPRPLPSGPASQPGRPTR